MPQNLGDWLSTALAVLVIASLAGYGSLRARVRDLKSQLDESRAETAAVRTGRADDKADFAEYRQEAEGKISTLTTDLDALGRTVRGEAEWAATADQLQGLRGELQSHHEAVQQHWRDEAEFWRRFEPKGRE